MAGRISITPDQFQTRIYEVERLRGDFETFKNNMRNMKNALLEEWEGAASLGFSEQYTQIENQSFTPLYDLMVSLQSQMQQTLQVIEQLDTDMGNAFRGSY